MIDNTTRHDARRQHETKNQKPRAPVQGGKDMGKDKTNALEKIAKIRRGKGRRQKESERMTRDKGQQWARHETRSQKETGSKQRPRRDRLYQSREG